jgi:A/G-specific adenine glycosylase
MSWPASAALLAPLAPWFDGNRRELPWRARDLDAAHTDPYAVLVSELMLQQTQVATVIPYFRAWMERWPTVAALAAATDGEVHKAWEGLGYYRRARLLHAAARRVAEAGWPEDLAGLRELPGLGDYTAPALAAQAFQWPEPALDGNAFRVLARVLGLEGDPKARARELRTWLRPALEAHGASRMTQALMELGARVCGPAPRCAGCPLHGDCAARKLGATARIPPPARRAKPKESGFWLVALEHEDRWLLAEPAAKGLLAGLWRWPTVPLPEAMEDRAAEHVDEYTPLEPVAWPAWTQVYSHRRERVNPLRLTLSAEFAAPEGMRWIPAADLHRLPMGKRDDRLRGLLDGPGEALRTGPRPALLLRHLSSGAAPVP